MSLSSPPSPSSSSLPKSTRYHRRNGRRTHQASAQSLQKLSPVEEEVLVNAIERLCDANWAPDNGHIIKLAEELIRDREDDSSAYLSRKWSQRFLKRHHRLLKARSTFLSVKRAKAQDSGEIERFFELLRKVRTENHIKRENMWNMDEKGWHRGKGPSTSVVVRRRHKNHDKQRKEASKNGIDTSIETISASGTYIKAFVLLAGSPAAVAGIYDESGVEEGMETLEDSKAVLIKVEITILATSNGWSNADTFDLYLREHFNKYTQTSSGEKRLLLLDGHRSHLRLKTLEFALQNGIIMMCLPAHTTHLLQPLDVGIFGPEAHEYRKEAADLSRGDLNTVDKIQFLKALAKARRRALKRRNIVSAWRKTGIEPFKPQQVSQQSSHREQTPSKVTAQTDKNSWSTPTKKVETDRILDDILSRHLLTPKTNLQIARLARGVQKEHGKLLMSQKREEDRKKALNAGKKRKRDLPTQQAQVLDATKIEELRQLERSKQQEIEKKQEYKRICSEYFEELKREGKIKQSRVRLSNRDIETMKATYQPYKNAFETSISSPNSSDSEL